MRHRSARNVVVAAALAVALAGCAVTPWRGPPEPATLAQYDLPYALAVDAAGDALGRAGFTLYDRHMTARATRLSAVRGDDAAFTVTIAPVSPNRATISFATRLAETGSHEDAAAAFFASLDARLARP